MSSSSSTTPLRSCPKNFDSSECRTRNVGTGPYRLVRRDAEGVVLEGFERYYMGPPRDSTIAIRPFDTIRTSWASLLRGEVDMVTDVPADAVEFVQNGDIQVSRFTRRYQFMIAFNSRVGAIPICRHHESLNTAVDRRPLSRRYSRDAANRPRGRSGRSTGPLTAASSPSASIRERQPRHSKQLDFAA